MTVARITAAGPEMARLFCFVRVHRTVFIEAMHPPEIPILDALTAGKTERHLVKLPGDALANDEPRPVITITGAKPGPVLFVNAGVHGGEYPAIEAVIRLGKTLDPQKIAGTIVLMPVLNLLAFRNRTMFVCPVDNVNPNRVFPGDPSGSYSEQMTHALINEFVVHADAYVDLHGGDIPEALVPFSICRGGGEAARAVEAVDAVDAKSKALAIAFGLPYVLTVTKPVQPAKGLSSYAAAAERGIPAVLAEAGGVGQLQEDAVEVLMNGVRRVMAHLGMSDSEGGGRAKSGSSAAETAATTVTSAIFTKFEWVYTKDAGMFYPRVAAGDLVQKGQEIGTIGSLFGDVLETIIAPVTGRVLFLTINPSVSQNDLLMGIGVAE
jgi:predicted deacylase